MGVLILGSTTASAYTLTRLGRIDSQGQSMPYGINNAGEVVGSSIFNSVETGFLWSDGQLTAVPGSTALVGLDDAGNAVGWVFANSKVDAVVYTPKGGLEYLFNPGNSDSVVREISASGTYVGHYRPWDETTQLYTGPQVAIVGQLGTPGATGIVAPPNTSIDAIGVNDAGLVVGTGYNPDAGEIAALTFAYPYLANNGTYLGTLEGGFEAVATDVSEAGVVVGYSTIAGSVRRGFTTTATGEMVALGVRNTANSTGWNYDARGINDYGTIVGNENANGTLRLVLYGPNGDATLPTVTPSAATSGLTRIYLPNTTLSASTYVGSPINEFGQIIAVGVFGTVQEAVLLNPEAPLVSLDEDGRGALVRIIRDEAYANIRFDTSELSDFASFIGGTTGANRTIEISLGEPQAGSVSTPRTVEITGTDTDTFMLQLRFNIADYEAESGSWENARLGWLNPESNAWELAVLGNIGGTDMFIEGNFPDDTLGSYGLFAPDYDPGYAYVWATLNHNSTFGVISVPEPAAATSLFAAAAIVWVLRRRIT